MAVARAWAERRRGRFSTLYTVPSTQLRLRPSICELSRRSSRGDGVAATAWRWGGACDGVGTAMAPAPSHDAKLPTQRRENCKIRHGHAR